MRLTRKQVKNAKDLLENLEDHKPATVPGKNRLTKKTKLVVALKKEVQRQEAKSPKTTKPHKIKPMFSLSRYLERKEEKKHGHHGHDHQH